ncbi:MAG: cytochrome c [Nitrospira sp.]|nr:cytochrome c [Nitrospira sp.]
MYGEREGERRLRIVRLAILTGLSPALNSGFAWAGDADVQSSGKNRAGDIRLQSLTGDSNRGEKLYQSNCIICHGPGATGSIDPRLAGNPVLSNEKTFWTVVYEGQHAMPPLSGGHYHPANGRHLCLTTNAAIA